MTREFVPVPPAISLEEIDELMEWIGFTHPARPAGHSPAPSGQSPEQAPSAPTALSGENVI